MKANHPNEAKRWIEAIGRNIEYFKQRGEAGGESDTSSGKKGKSMESLAENAVRFSIAPSTSNDSTSGSISTTSHHAFWRKGSGSSKDRDQESIIGSISVSNSTPLELTTPTFPDSDLLKNGTPESEKEDDDDESSDTKENDLEPPHSNLHLQGNALTAQLEITQHLAESMTVSSQVSTAQTIQTHQALSESLQTTRSLFSTFLHMSRDREDWFARQLRNEQKRQRVWEESLAVVVKEGEGLERELRKRRGRGMSFLAGGGTQKEWGGKRRPSLVGMSTTGTIKGSPVALLEEFSDRSNTVSPAPLQGLKGAPMSRTSTIDNLVASIPPPLPAPIIITPAVSQMEEITASEEQDHDTDEEDEFFDAIETGNLPNLVVYEGLTSPKSIASPGLLTPRASIQDIPTEPKALGPSDIRSLSISQTLSLSMGVGVEPFAGYAALRNRLSITEDERPSTSLWSVLKHSIGKDLTKISFPVFFNEPTSMLQRMAEDMEFSECRKFILFQLHLIRIKIFLVDVAAHEKDPLLRIAFVAAFAMSNYSSTIGRIAKPFNPMLVGIFC